MDAGKYLALILMVSVSIHYIFDWGAWELLAITVYTIFNIFYYHKGLVENYSIFRSEITPEEMKFYLVNAKGQIKERIFHHSQVLDYDLEDPNWYRAVQNVKFKTEDGWVGFSNLGAEIDLELWNSFKI